MKLNWYGLNSNMVFKNYSLIQTCEVWFKTAIVIKNEKISSRKVFIFIRAGGFKTETEAV